MNSVTTWHMQHTATGALITCAPSEYEARRKDGYAPISRDWSKKPLDERMKARTK